VTSAEGGGGGATGALPGRAPAPPSGARAATPWRRRLRALLLTVIALLYVFSIPWYRPAGGSPSLLWGLPDWVFVALVCYGAVALLNAGAWLAAEVPEGDQPEDDGAPR
jgi:hypothetical protein